MRQFSTILWEQAEGVGRVTLNRPERLNAFTLEMAEELSTLWRDLRGDDTVRCVVLGAAGSRAFCSGIDRDSVPADGGVDYDFSPFTYDDPGALLGPKSNGLWKPVIAAVDGIACGGAFYLLGEVDFIVATRAARFFDPHVTYGMPAVYEPLLMLHRGMPFGEVLRMTLMGTAEHVSAERAHQIGLVSEVVADADALRQATAWAARAIAAAPPGPVQATLRTLWAGRELSRRQALDLGNTFLNLGMDEAALAEGQKVFSSSSTSRTEPRVR